MISFKVTNYNIQIHTDVNNPAPYEAFIGLNLEDAAHPPHNAVAFLNFYPDTTATALPDNSVRNDGGTEVYAATFRKCWFSAILDVLRNEMPITFWFDETTKEAVLGTGTQEPVGEGEN